LLVIHIGSGVRVRGHVGTLPPIDINVYSNMQISLNAP
jgi:hypothetical protein